MTDQEKIAYILEQLELDAPASNTGKILKAVLIATVPGLMTVQLDQIIGALE